MTMQRLCHDYYLPALVFAVVSVLASAGPVRGDPPVNDYPTHVRVEFVNECIAGHGGNFSNLYKCSCAIDRIAQVMSYDDFVEASTFSRYAGLPGEGGAIFRDSDQAQKMAKLFRKTESDAYRHCGLPAPSETP